MGTVPFRVGLTLFLLSPVCLELAPDTRDVRRHPPAGFQITAERAQAGVDSDYCRLYVLTLPLSTV